MDAALVVVAAGTGSRLGLPCRKALVEIAGAPLVVHTLRRLLAAPGLDPVVVVGHADDRDELQRHLDAFGRDIALVDGGARRQDSVAAGLAALGDDDRIVLVHDAARPFPPVDRLPRLIEAAAESGCAILADPITDTIKEEHAERAGVVARTRDRNRLWAAQTPQAFQLLQLRRRLADATETVTDEARLFEADGVVLVPGSRENYKITTMDDLRSAELALGREAAGDSEP